MGTLHRALCKQGISSRVLVDSPGPDDDANVESIHRWKLDGALRRICVPLGLNDVFRVSSFALPRDARFTAADVVHIHGTHSGYLNYLALPTLARAKPCLMTLHDSWSLTGHCAYPQSCERWRRGCGQCPDLARHPAMRRDATALEFRLKKQAFLKSNLTLVAVSRDQAKFVRESHLGGMPLHVIPNGIDTSIFRPGDRNGLRAELGLPSERTLLLFCARSLNDPLKGYDLLLGALTRLPARLRANLGLIAVGQYAEVLYGLSDIPIYDMGSVADPELRSKIFASADLSAMPSRAEAMGMVAAESLACGTPVVGFPTGGIPDVVQHGITGYVTDSINAEQLSDGLACLLADDAKRTAMRDPARRDIVRRFDTSSMVAQYLTLYWTLAQSQADKDADSIYKRTIE